MPNISGCCSPSVANLTKFLKPFFQHLQFSWYLQNIVKIVYWLANDKEHLHLKCLTFEFNFTWNTYKTDFKVILIFHQQLYLKLALGQQ